MAHLTPLVQGIMPVQYSEGDFGFLRSTRLRILLQSQLNSPRQMQSYSKAGHPQECTLRAKGQGIQDGLEVSTEDVLYGTIPISNRDTSFIIQRQNVSGLFPPIAEAIPEISCVQFSILVVQTPYRKGRVSGDTLTWHIWRPAFNSSSTGNGK